MNGPAGRPAILGPAIVLMSGRMLGFLVALAIPMVLVRLLDQHDFGGYKQLFLIFGTLFGIAQIGMAESLYYFLPQDPHSGGRYAANALLALGVAGSAFFVLLCVFDGSVAGLLNNPGLEPYIPVIGLYLLFMLLAAPLEICMTALRKNVLASASYAVSDFVRAALYLAPLFILGGLQWLLAGAVLFAAVRFIAALVYLRREYPGGVVADAALLRKQLAYALPFGAAVLIEALQVNFHMYAVSNRFDAATFAIYAVGCLQLPVVDFMMTSTSNVMMVGMLGQLRQGHSQAAVAIWQDTTRKLALLFFPFVAALLLVAHEFITVLFTASYSASVPIFMLWTATIILAAFNTDGVLRVYAETRFLIGINLLRLFVVIACIGWFMREWGLAGAVLATMAATASAKLLALVRMKHVMKCSLAEILPWSALLNISLITCAAALAAAALKSALDAPPAVLMVFIPVVFGAIYVPLLLTLGPITAEERSELLANARRPIIALRRAFTG